jgi:hypothetical protein
LKIESGKWKMENGKWKMENEKTENGKWKVMPLSPHYELKLYLSCLIL